VREREEKEEKGEKVVGRSCEKGERGKILRNGHIATAIHSWAVCRERVVWLVWLMFFTTLVFIIVCVDSEWERSVQPVQSTG
jgi:hypothetical protein